ncbi:hypothetical protein GKE82_12180 [Conexibacter sp. W3-3-2]|uniref:hypothetical protein n=1 Tax=Conexibacter sp. W3-3-2 TaxID=2675227 RepID=UPI0012B769FD|nr:hypothetical protein [Conexibacter sp. W3-3-2]MTD45028.1 hypothetical protein [Conexibacter sp. W3-3-2]
MSETMYGPGGRMYGFPPGMRAVRHDDDVHALAGARIDDVEGRRIGTIAAILVSRHDGHNRFFLVRRRGRSGGLCAVPVQGAVAGGGRVWCPYPGRQIDRGPRLPEHGVLSPRVDRELRGLFGLPAPATEAPAWERRASVSRAQRDPARPEAILWIPGPRAANDRRSGLDRRTGEPAPGAAPTGDGALPVALERRRQGRRITDLLDG